MSDIYTADEFKKLRSLMEQRATECYQSHKQTFKDWQEGGIAKIWIDGQGNLCIEYESGNWWHYNEQGEWW